MHTYCVKKKKNVFLITNQPVSVSSPPSAVKNVKTNLEESKKKKKTGYGGTRWGSVVAMMAGNRDGQIDRTRRRMRGNIDREGVAKTARLRDLALL